MRRKLETNYANQYLNEYVYFLVRFYLSSTLKRPKTLVKTKDLETDGF